ncbi:MAG: GGDEF domain-containing protein [Gammaproteobacteria bacterium]|nr:GGDEF domain-containing protein [Gammaproteobacteria bacterium]
MTAKKIAASRDNAKSIAKHFDIANEVELGARRKILLLLCVITAILWLPVGYAVYLVTGSLYEASLVSGSTVVWAGMGYTVYRWPRSVDAVGWLSMVLLATLLFRRIWVLYTETIIPDPTMMPIAPVLLFLPNLLLAAFVLVPPKQGLRVSLTIWALICIGAIYLGLPMAQEQPPRQFLPGYWVYFFVAMPSMILFMNIIKIYAKALIQASEDMLAQQQQLGEMRALAYEDYLTGLANRREFERKLDASWDKAVSDQGCIGIVFIDVDHFKSFNDLAGHDKGDDCLVSISEALRQGLAGTDWVLARFGGEEFCILASSCDANDLAQVAEQVRYAVHEAGIEHPNPDLDRVTVSVGAAYVTPTIQNDKRNLLRRADQALYQAKAAGRNQCIVSLSENPQEIVAA